MFDSRWCGTGPCCYAEASSGAWCECYCENCPVEPCNCQAGCCTVSCGCGGGSYGLIESIPSQLISDASDFADWCNNYGSNNVIILGSIVEVIVSEINDSDQEGYNAAEANYRNQYLLLSSQEVSDIEQWWTQNGY